MSNAYFKVPTPYNEPVLSYQPGSSEKETLKAKLAEMGSQQIEVPLIIGGQEVKTGNTAEMCIPHNHQTPFPLRQSRDHILYIANHHTLLWAATINIHLITAAITGGGNFAHPDAGKASRKTLELLFYQVGWRKL